MCSLGGVGRSNLGAIAGSFPGANGPSRTCIRVAGIGGAAKNQELQKVHSVHKRHKPWEQVWSPIWEMGMSALQLEHLIDGRNEDTLAGTDAMFVLRHRFLARSR